MNIAVLHVTGDPSINRNNGRFGYLSITMGPYWQKKRVTRIGKTNYCWMINLGWLLDDIGQPRALFLFSPRLARIK